MRAERWTPRQALAWYDELPWLVGCNFIPSTAVNQLEMWQRDTFDPATIDRELELAAHAGLTTVRVYLHDVAWEVDRDGLLARIDRFLAIADRHGIVTMLVLFDDCWHDDPRPGPQPSPVPGVHNSRWAQSPGSAVVRHRAWWPRLEAYVTDVVRRFGDDRRVLAWDLYNEVGNRFMPALSAPLPRRPFAVGLAVGRHLAALGPSLALLRATFSWARRARPSQPLTSGVWLPDPRISRAVVALSDVLSFHHYRGPESLDRQIQRLRRHGRPLLCTEYMARSQGSTIGTHLPILHRERIACYSWGLVRGRTQTVYPWRTKRSATGEPNPWFHDLLHPDGTPYDAAEIALIHRLRDTPSGVTSA